MTAATVTPIHARSLQGDQQQARDQALAMAPADVDAYVDSAPEPVLICRESGHTYPSIREAGIRFTDVDTEGLFVRRLRCLRCDLATRVEKWEATGRGRHTRYRKVGASGIDYDPAYLAPAGAGRMTRRQVQESLATRALAGQPAGQLRRDLIRTRRTRG